MLRSTAKTVLKTSAVVSVLYGAGVAVATQSDAFNEIFTDNVPLAEEAVDFTKSMLNPQTREENINNFKEKFAGFEDTLKVPKASGIQSSKIESLEARESQTKEPQPKTTVVDEAKKAVSDIHLPHLDIQVKDSHVQQVIQEFNDVVSKINAGQFDKLEKLDKIKEIFKALDANLIKLSSKSDQEFQKRLSEQISAKEVEILSKFTQELNASLQAKDKQHQQQLEAEVAKNKEALEAHYKNEAKLASIKAQDEITNVIAESIETERNGKLSNFKELNTKLEALQNLVLSIDEHLTNAELKVKLQLSLNKLKFKLHSDKIHDLSNDFNELVKLSEESKNEVITSALKAIDVGTIKSGLLTQSQLITRFNLLAPELRSTALLPPYAGVLGHLSAKLFSALMFKKEGQAQGKDIESVIARVQDNLINNRLDAAVEEVSQLKGWSRRLADDWIVETRKRLEVEFLVNLIDLESRTLY